MGNGTREVKRCGKSEPEPECLTEFRRENPGGDWNKFRGGGRPCYDTVRATLAADQHGLCAYCETSLTPDNRQIAHYHPKSDTDGPVNHGLRWTNMWLACLGGSSRTAGGGLHWHEPTRENISCDQATENQIPDGGILAPCDVPAFPRIVRYMQVPDALRLVADEDGCRAAGIPVEKVERTIQVLNLNCLRLAKARLAVSRALTRPKSRIREFPTIQQPKLWAALIQQHLGNGKIPEFFTVYRWAFNSGGVEAYLGESDFEG